MAQRILETPIRINKMELRNRMAMPPMNTNYTNENGGMTDMMMDYYARRAKGGAGLITLEAFTFDAKSRNHGAQPRITDTSFIPGLSRLVDKIHRYGAKASIEINHYGSEGTVPSGEPEVSSSNVTSRGAGYEIHSLTLDELKKMQQDYVDAIVYAQMAGFDAITYHAAHGNIMPQFFSKMFNKRTDWYGGSLENRARFAREIVEMSRAAVGPNFPLIMRISGEEYFSEGRKLEETIEFCKIMEKAGIDAFDISGGIQPTYLFSIAPGNFPGIKGFMMPNAKAIKEAVSVPVIGVGGVRDAEYAEQLLQEGYADIIALGRSMIADPDFCVKTLAGNDKDIRPCITCNNCLMEIDKDRFLSCTVNAEAGREDDFKGIDKADTKKKVLVVGAGAAGMEAARVSAMRGHDVTLIDKEGRLGGTMYVAGLPPHKESIIDLVEWYKNQLADLGVKINLNTQYSPKMKDNFDHVFIATGADYMRMIPGSDGKNVMTATEALLNPEKVGEKVVVIGGGSCGSEVAEFFGAREIDLKLIEYKNFDGDLLVETSKNSKFKNKDVTIVEMTCELCCDMEPFTRIVLENVLKYNGVKSLRNATVLDISDGKVRVIDTEAGKLLELEADTVILSAGLAPNRVDDPSLKTTFLGDASKPGKIVNAVFMAYSAAREI
ncbi:MAG: FAD-dependent oxidoreductase [Christensenellaceae bacterium]